MAISFFADRSMTLARTLMLVLALGTNITSAISAPSLMTPGVAGNAARTRFDIKSAAMPILLNRAALDNLQRQDEFELVLPNATRHMIVFDRIEDHGGIRSSVGFLKDFGKDYRVIITTGPTGSFGSIRTPDTNYRIVPGQDGQDLLVDMTEEHKHIPFIELGNDARRAPLAPSNGIEDEGLAVASTSSKVQGGEPGILLSTPTPQTTVDLMIVYTKGLATRLGAGLMTRLYNLVTAANTAYIDSEVAITLRLVNATMVNYPDAPEGDGTALDAITPSFGGGSGVFSNIEAIRNANGADLVSFLRNGSDFGGSGIAWLTTTALRNL